MKYLLRTILAVFVLFLLVCTIVIAANWRDQALRPEVEAALNWQAPTKIDEDNGYLMVLGFNAKEGVDPMQLGKRKLQRELERYQLALQGVEEFSNAKLDGDELEFKRPLEEICKYEQAENCVAFYLSRSAVEEDQILAKHHLLLNRFAMLSRLNTYVEIVPPHITANIPAFSSITYASELERMRAVRMIASGKVDEGRQKFLDNAAFSQRWLGQARSLISHMIALAMVQRDVRLAEELSRAYPQFLSNSAPVQAWLSGFSMEKMNIATALDAETKSMLRLMHTELHFEQAPTSAWKKALASLLLTPNAGVNLSYDWYQVLTSPLRDRDIAFDQKMQIATAKRSELLGWGIGSIYLKNPLAKVLLSIGEPVYQTYIEKHYDSFAQINLLSLKVAMIEQHIPQSEVAHFVQDQARRFSNPYDGSALGWDAQKQELFVALRQPNNQLHLKAKEFRSSLRSLSAQAPMSVVQTH